MSQNNTKDKQLVCCKSCDGKGYIRRHLKIDIPCRRCKGIGNVPWLNNLVNKEDKIALSRRQIDESYYHILVLVKNLKELCYTIGIKPEIKLMEKEYIGDISDRIEERVKNNLPFEYSKLKKEK